MTIVKKAKKLLATADNGSKECKIYNDGFLDGTEWGYKEAMRWRDPKKELPLNHNAVFVKYKTQKGALKYGVGRYLDIGMGNPWTIEGSVSREIIGWKSNEIS